MNNSISLELLTEIGEWAAAGFYEGAGLPWPRCYGLAYRRLYESMPVRVLPNRRLLPCEPFHDAHTQDSHSVWTATALICDFDHNRGLRVNTAVAEDKKLAFPQHARIIDTLVEDLSPRLPHFGGYTHNNPDMRRVVAAGVLAMERELEEQLAAAVTDGDDGNPAEVHLLLTLRDYVAGIKAYHARVADAIAAAVRRADGGHTDRLADVSSSFRHAFLNPARTFLEGILAVNFTWMLDGCDSIGRFDQVLGPLYEQDIASGALDVQFARSLLDELWQNFERLNAWNMQLGGYTPGGGDGCNAFTRECIAACGRNHVRRPNVALRITGSTPEDVLHQALTVLADGSGRPALYNDDLYVKTLLDMDLGLTPEDAREVGFGGCTETMIAGLSNCGSLEGYLNLAKAVELALRDGFDPVSREQAGPHTGKLSSFVSYDAFEDAVRRQVQYMTDAFVARSVADLRRRFSDGDPKPYRTFFTRDCVKNRRSFEAGGARYNWSVVSYHGIANAIDSLSAVRRCVFKERSVGARELLVALDSDFAEHEEVRARLQQSPRFGNDDDAVDRPGAEFVRFAWETLCAHETPRGGRYLPSCILFATYGQAGKQVGALPDGRRAFEPLTDSIGPAQGRDTLGPTAMLKSVVKLPLSLGIGTPVLNIRFQRRVLTGAAGLAAVSGLIRSFFAQGGMQIQLSVLDKEDMLAAQRAPEAHADLIVRIGGYSEYFTRLDRALQDTVIARTEHSL